MENQPRKRNRGGGLDFKKNKYKIKVIILISFSDQV